MRIEENNLSVQQFEELFRSVGWHPPLKEQIEVALTNSTVTFCVYDGERAVGMARLLGDQAMSYYLKDFAISPDYQGKGVGRYLMEYILEYIYNHLEIGWAVSVELMSAKGKEAFYRKFCFEERPCEWDGAGMFMMLRRF